MITRLGDFTNLLPTANMINPCGKSTVRYFQKATSSNLASNVNAVIRRQLAVLCSGSGSVVPQFTDHRRITCARTLGARKRGMVFVVDSHHPMSAPLRISPDALVSTCYSAPNEKRRTASRRCGVIRRLMRGSGLDVAVVEMFHTVSAEPYQYEIVYQGQWLGYTIIKIPANSKYMIWPIRMLDRTIVTEIPDLDKSRNASYRASWRGHYICTPLDYYVDSEAPTYSVAWKRLGHKKSSVLLGH